MFWKIAGSLGFCLLTILSGAWLSHAGKPLSVPILTAHKLLALATIVFALLAVVQWLRSAPLGLIPLLLLILAGLLVLVLFATGAFLSSGKPELAIFRTFHQIATLLAAAAAIALVWGPK